MPIKVLFVCLGNICRSPMCEVILKDMVEKRGLTDQFEIRSAGTSDEEVWNGIGNPVYPPAAEELRSHGLGKTPYTDFREKRAIQITAKDYGRYDYILCADKANIRGVTRITGPDTEGKISLLLDHTDRPGRSIADPWYTREFGTAYRDCLEGCEAFLKELGY